VSVDRVSKRVLSVGDAEAAAGVPVLASIREVGRRRARGRTSEEEIARDLVPVRDALLDGSASRKVVLLASPSDGAGTSTIATLLARIFAGSRRRVLVVEFRYQDGHARGTADAGVDLEHAALDRARATDEPSRLLVWIPQSGSPSEPEHVGRLMASMEASAFDVAIIDAPSGRGDTFYLQVVPHADAVVLVAGYDLTGRHALARMAELVRREGATIAGCILNRRRDPIPESIYRSWF
jgi:Mrp family chromosome partitioning ATPase